MLGRNKCGSCGRRQPHPIECPQCVRERLRKTRQSLPFGKPYLVSDHVTVSPEDMPQNTVSKLKDELRREKKAKHTMEESLKVWREQSKELWEENQQLRKEQAGKSEWRASALWEHERSNNRASEIFRLQSELAKERSDKEQWKEQATSKARKIDDLKDELKQERQQRLHAEKFLQDAREQIESLSREDDQSLVEYGLREEIENLKEEFNKAKDENRELRAKLLWTRYIMSRDTGRTTKDITKEVLELWRENER